MDHAKVIQVIGATPVASFSGAEGASLTASRGGDAVGEQLAGGWPWNQQRV